ncbi:MAG: hypothetical protein R3A10_13210 [Caldilineaceae bacterium]
MAAAGYTCINIGKMHTYPYHTPLGFPNATWSKTRTIFWRALLLRRSGTRRSTLLGLVKQQRELYRQLPDYADRLGAFSRTARGHALGHVRGQPGPLVVADQAHARRPTLFMQIDFPGRIRPDPAGVRRPIWNGICRSHP